MRAAVKADLTPYHVPEWNQDVYIRKLSVKDQLAVTEDSPRPEVASVRILLISIVDANGDRLLGDDDMDLLMDQPFPVVMPLMAEVAKLNGLSTEELEVAMAAFGPARDEQPSTSSLSLSGAPSENSKPSPVPS